MIFWLRTLTFDPVWDKICVDLKRGGALNSRYKAHRFPDWTCPAWVSRRALNQECTLFGQSYTNLVIVCVCSSVFRLPFDSWSILKLSILLMPLIQSKRGRNKLVCARNYYHPVSCHQIQQKDTKHRRFWVRLCPGGHRENLCIKFNTQTNACIQSNPQLTSTRGLLEMTTKSAGRNVDWDINDTSLPKVFNDFLFKF